MNALQLLSDEIRYDTDGLSIATFFEKHFVQHHFKDTLDVFIAENEGLFNQLLEYLGRHDDNTYLNMGSNRTTLDIMQQIIEWKLALHPYDRDMIVMLHEFGYEIAQKKYITRAHLIVKGNDEQYTAMANTVGLPLGIAAYLILKNKISLIGLKIPTDPAIYEPVLLELEASGIQFKAQTNEVA